MASNNYKAPPALSKCTTYDTWLKEIKIWQKFTDLPTSKQGPAIFLTLEGRAREAVLELEVDNIGSDGGVANIIEKLNTLYLRDKAQSAYEAYDTFEKFRRPAYMSISEYINEFERLHSKTKHYGTAMSTDILAYRLLKSADLSEYHQQLAKATISKLDYETMKSQLKKIFGDSVACSIEDSGSSFSNNVKVENTFEATDEQDILYGNNYKGYRNYRGQYVSRGGQSQMRLTAQRGRSRGRWSRGSGVTGSSVGAGRRGRNPLDENGTISRCTICDSINHWMANCPDAVYYQGVNVDEAESCDHHITLFQSNLITKQHMKAFVSESFSAAILDSGATATVAGKMWLECYIDSLQDEQNDMITYKESTNSFKFGSGEVFQSMYKVKIPAIIGSHEVFIETDVIDNDIPMLLSKKAMKTANTSINFKDDTVTMLGRKQNVLVTRSGHYAIPLRDKNVVLSDIVNRSAKITLHIYSAHMQDKTKIARKLHSQFSHPQASRLIKLAESAGMGWDRELIDAIHSVTNSCQICRDYRRPFPKPVVGMPVATEFNEVVAMDLKMVEGKWIFHLIDHVSRFSAASFVKTKSAEEIIEKIFQIWISVFGPPKKFLSDNGGEIVNEQFQTLCESFNITVLTTAAEAPWSNGLCERHNAVLGDMLQKTYAEGKCNLNTALCWAIHAKNSLANVHGFSPYQLAIGYTPRLPSVLYNRPPALECSSSKIVLENLSSIAEARKAFVESESSEKIKRALRHNQRPSSNNKFYTGDIVYYKRNDSKNGRGQVRQLDRMLSKF